MTAYPGWTPASRPGIVPLHPLGFGTILGRSFTALRQNPRVLLGFALGVQVIGYLVTTAAVAGVAFWSFSRLDTLRPGTDEWNAVSAGSLALTIVTAVVLGLAVTALGVVVQGVVVAEVSREVVAERQTLGQLWSRVRPVVWRLLGYTLLLTLVIVVILGAIVLALVALASIGQAAIVAAVLLGILLLLAAIPLLLWLGTKLALVPAVIVLERATLGAAIGRSWRLIRGRFWPALGVIVIISISISVVGQVVSVPFSLLSAGLSTIIAPTGEPTPSAVVGLIASTLLTQAVVLVVQAAGLVVQATAASLIYVDCRMRHEGLDLDLLAYVDRRDAGEPDLPDPYTPHPDRPHPPRPAYAPYPASGYAPPPAYGQYAPPYPPPPLPPTAPDQPPAATQWAPPGGSGREAP